MFKEEGSLSMTYEQREAKRIGQQISTVIKEAQKFQFDKEFIQCLSDEIQASTSEGLLKMPAAKFKIDEHGCVEFCSICELIESLDANEIYIQLEKQLPNVEIKDLDEMIDIELKRKKSKLIDKLLNQK